MKSMRTLYMEAPSLQSLYVGPTCESPTASLYAAERMVPSAKRRQKRNIRLPRQDWHFMLCFGPLPHWVTQQDMTLKCSYHDEVSHWF